MTRAPYDKPAATYAAAGVALSLLTVVALVAAVVEAVS